MFPLAVGFLSLNVRAQLEKKRSALLCRSVQGAQAHPLPACAVMSAPGIHHVLEFLQVRILFRSFTPRQVFFYQLN